MANLSSVFTQRLRYPPTSAEKREAFQTLYPDISAAKGQHEGHLQWRAINRFYIGSFFIRLPFIRTAVSLTLSALTFTEHQKQPCIAQPPSQISRRVDVPVHSSSCNPHKGCKSVLLDGPPGPGSAEIPANHAGPHRAMPETDPGMQKS